MDRVATSSQAKELFLQGVELERSGQHFLAILRYKRAVHMVPDIEFRTFELMRRGQQQQQQQQQQQGQGCHAWLAGPLLNREGCYNKKKIGIYCI